MEPRTIKDYISLNQKIRNNLLMSGGEKNVAHGNAQNNALVNSLSSALSTASSGKSVYEQLYSIPEIAVCVDFWFGNLGTKTFVFSSANEAFEKACAKYFASQEQIKGTGITFLDIFNRSARDYIFYGNEVFYATKTLVEVDGFKFPKMLTAIPYKDASIEDETTLEKGCLYDVEYLDKTYTSPEIFLVKRLAGVYQPYGVSMLERAIRPVTSALNDNSLDQSLAKMGIMSAFVLVKYGTNEEPRDDQELEDLHTELSKNMQSGIAFGVVPPDITVESLFKSSATSSFNRDKIYETYVDAIDIAFGGVINTIKPDSNSGGGSEKSLIFLRNLIQAERENRKRSVFGPLMSRIRLINSIEEECEVKLTELDILINSIQDSRIKDFDRGAMSLKTYLGENYDSEISRIKREWDTGEREVIQPRDLPYTKSGGSDGAEQEEEEIQEEGEQVDEEENQS